MHNYANLCIIMHATYTILFSSLPGIMMKVCVKFHLDPINGFWEKVERTDVRTNEENYNIDSFTLSSPLPLDLINQCVRLYLNR